jgi:hypothetical protein
MVRPLPPRQVVDCSNLKPWLNGGGAERWGRKTVSHWLPGFYKRKE